MATLKGLGIKVPKLDWSPFYSDAEITQQAPRKYGLAYPGSHKKWKAMASHPGYITEVRKIILLVQEQIKRAKKNPQQVWQETAGLVILQAAAQDLHSLTDACCEIASDIEYDCAKDIAISVQQHPIINHLIEVRDSLKKARKS